MLQGSEILIARAMLMARAGMARIVGALAVLLVAAAPLLVVSPASADEGLVQVQDAGNPRNSVSGIVVGAGNQIVTSSAFVAGRTRLVVRFTPGGEAYPAVVDAADAARGIALLSVESAAPVAPRTFASADVERGGEVFVAYVEANGATAQSAGRVVDPSVRRSQSGAAHFWVHNAEIQSRAYGAALVNLCGEVVGLTVANPFDSRPDATRAPRERAYALRIGDVIEFLTGASVTTPRATAACTTAAGVTAAPPAVSAGSPAQEAETETPEARISRAETEARDARAEAERLREEAEQIRNDHRASEKQKREAEEAAQAAQAAAEAAAVAEANLAEELAEKQSAVESLEGDVQARKRLLIYVAAGAAAALALLGAVAFFLVRGRGRKAKRAEAGLADAVRQLNETFPDVECRGADALGRPHAFKISGSALLRPPYKLTIGRQPDSANIVLTHPEISRTHALIVRAGDQVAITDNQSTNGTFVNGERLKDGEVRTLRDGDQLSLGKISFMVRYIHAQ